MNNISVTRYKYSIIQTEQNTKRIENDTKYKTDKMQKFQNTNTTKYKLLKYKCEKIQMNQNTNGIEYKWNQMLKFQNTNMTK